MRVLFFNADTVSGPVRIMPMLEALRTSGKIEAYSCVSRDMAISSPDSVFDALIVHRNPSERQFAWLQRSGVPFIYDIDDLLLSQSRSLTGRKTKEQYAIRWCLTNAQFVTSPSRYLLATLEHRLGEQLGERAVYLPNAGLKPIATRKPSNRPMLLWVSSHGYDYEEFHEVGAGIATAARVIGTEVLLVGRFPPAVMDLLGGAHHVPWLEPRQFASFLSEGPFVAAAPMPVDLEPDQQVFVDCKSDIKAAQYGSLGIAALYSSALPYRESDLPCRLARSNSAADWERGIIQLAENYPGAGAALRHHPAVIARRVELVGQQLLAILQSIREKTDHPFRFRAIATPAAFRRVEQSLRSLRLRLLRR